MKNIKPALYLRVSTDDQTTDNQLPVLFEAAKARGWVKKGEMLCVYADSGVSGRKGREHRPGYDRLLTDVEAKGVTLVMAWSIDRVGRSMRETLRFMDELKRRGCGLYLHQQQMDTTTPYGEAMLQMAMIFAELESKMIGERVRAAYRRMRQDGKKIGRFPVLPPEKEDQIRRMLGSATVRQIAKTVGCGHAPVQRLKREMEALR